MTTATIEGFRQYLNLFRPGYIMGITAYWINPLIDSNVLWLSRGRSGAHPIRNYLVYLLSKEGSKEWGSSYYKESPENMRVNHFNLRGITSLDEFNLPDWINDFRRKLWLNNPLYVCNYECLGVLNSMSIPLNEL